MPRIHRRLSVRWFAPLVALLASGCAAGIAVGLADEPLEGLPPYGEISPDEAVAVILALRGDPGFALLDVRTPAEVAAGHLPGGNNIDFRNDSFADEVSALDRGVIYLLYCRTANRSGRAFELMTQMGFKKVYDMQGGIRLWGELGYPICAGPLGEEHVCAGEYPGRPAEV
jgi:rhodanese-related sulfurtransferase